MFYQMSFKIQIPSSAESKRNAESNLNGKKGGQSWLELDGECGAPSTW
jgi:hypothetical protein